MSTISSREPLDSRITSRTIRVKDLDVHILEASPRPGAPLIFLLHGFPELSYSWRKIIIPLSAAGFHVVAPDQRGYGRTVPHNAPDRRVEYSDDLTQYRLLNLVADVLAIVTALGHTHAAAVIGHDFGSLVAGACALTRPDVFHAVVMMSAPFPGVPSSPKEPTPTQSTGSGSGDRGPLAALDQYLAALNPPRKHYTSYFCTSAADSDMLNAPGGLSTFLRTYYHVKSADWASNAPHPLPHGDPAALAVMPPYYIMPLDVSMPEAVASHAPSAEEVARNTWLTDAELAVYAHEFAHTGFQGGLNWYRAVLGTSPAYAVEMSVFAGRHITAEVPALFVGGVKDWGVYQSPGALDRMQGICDGMAQGEDGIVLIDHAGHWVQQERPEEVVSVLLRFLGKHTEVNAE